MESAADEHLSSSSSSSSSACYGLGTSYPILNTNGFHCFPLEPQTSTALPSSMSPQDFTFHWSGTDIFPITTQFSESYHPAAVSDGFDINLRKLLHKPFSSSANLTNKIQFSSQDDSKAYQQILLPDINHGMIAESPSSFDHMNLDSLDLLASSRLSRTFDHDSSQLQTGISEHGFPYAFNYIMPSLSSTSLKVSESTNEAAVDGLKESQTLKKPRLETRSGCPPLKVRKEKLGDRIAALQQLVAPFGKTDTASVLMEAIGYIKFLQNQVETLTVPYMKASRTKQGTKGEEMKSGLKSRGLCLVPVSWLSYIADGSGSVVTVWPPSYYGGT